MRTSTMFDRGAPRGRSPVNVALLRMVGKVNTKSSADSISILPAELGRDAVAMRPSGLPVLKWKRSADAEVARIAIEPTTVHAQRGSLMMSILSRGPPRIRGQFRAQQRSG